MDEFLSGEKYLRLTVDDIPHLDKLASLDVKFVSGDTLYGDYIKKTLKKYNVIYLKNNKKGVTFLSVGFLPSEEHTICISDIKIFDVSENELMEILNDR